MKGQNYFLSNINNGWCCALAVGSRIERASGKRRHQKQARLCENEFSLIFPPHKNWNKPIIYKYEFPPE